MRLRKVRSDGFIPPCIPTRAAKPPSGHGWVREIKHDGYRLQVHRVGDLVRLFTRRGYDWSTRYPAISVTATLLRELRPQNTKIMHLRITECRLRVCGNGVKGPLLRSLPENKSKREAARRAH
jgi:hypothetical protein